MTKLIRVRGVPVVVIEATPDDICTMCGASDETRPYGPNFTQICFECGQKDEAATRANFLTILFGETYDA